MILSTGNFIKNKTIISLLIVSLTVILCACGHKHTWINATCTTPVTCSECGETAGEPAGHKWEAATCTKPKTCSVCGETEGEPLGHTWKFTDDGTASECSVCGEKGTVSSGYRSNEPESYFDKYGITVRDKLESFSINSMFGSRMKNPTRVYVWPATYSFKEYTVKPSSRSGYKTIKLTITIKRLKDESMIPAVNLGSLWDYYTGYKFTSKDGYGNETNEFYDSISVNGKVYKIFYTRSMQWAETSKKGSDNLSYFEEKLMYTIDIPNNYDGLVIGFTYYEEADWGYDPEVDEGYIPTDGPEDGYYFHIGN